MSVHISAASKGLLYTSSLFSSPLLTLAGVEQEGEDFKIFGIFESFSQVLCVTDVWVQLALEDKSRQSHNHSPGKISAQETSGTK